MLVTSLNDSRIWPPQKIKRKVHVRVSRLFYKIDARWLLK